MKEDAFKESLIRLTAIFSEADLFCQRYRESTNEENRAGWIFRLGEKFGEAKSLLNTVLSDEDIFLLLEQFEKNEHSPWLTQYFLKAYLGERLVEKFRYNIEQGRIPVTGPHDGGYESEWN